MGRGERREGGREKGRERTMQIDSLQRSFMTKDLKKKCSQNITAP